jgi:hypothetical protein
MIVCVPVTDEGVLDPLFKGKWWQWRRLTTTTYPAVRRSSRSAVSPVR